MAICGHHQLPGADKGRSPLMRRSTSFTQDQTGKKVQYALADVKGRSPRVVVVDFPPRAPRQGCVEALQGLGFFVDVQELLATEYGDPVAVNRVLAHAELKGAWKGDLNVAVPGALKRQERPCGIVP